MNFTKGLVLGVVGGGVVVAVFFLFFGGSIDYSLSSADISNGTLSKQEIRRFKRECRNDGGVFSQSYTTNSSGRQTIVKISCMFANGTGISISAIAE